MSWTIGFIGTPDKVVGAMETETQKYSGLSKEEYEQALPHLVALVKQNFNKEGGDYKQPIIKINASGSGYTVNGRRKQEATAKARAYMCHGNLLSVSSI